MSNTFNIKRTATNGDGVALHSVAHPRPTSKIDLIIDALSVAQNSVWSKRNEEALAAARELRELKPVAWMLPEYGDVLPASQADGTGIYTIPLYTAPPRKPWQGLTDEEIKEAIAICKASWHAWAVDPIALCNYIETKLKELNT